jgi:CO/xanthine dehydrogenase Mo-binding subunit
MREEAVVTHVLGQPIGRVDGADKVTGGAVYTPDLPLEGVLWGKVLYSPYPHARIVSIDTSAAKALPGVHAVITGDDVGNGLYGANLKDMPILAHDRVRFAGERVAAVAAVDEDTAQAALDLIEVEYEELPAVFDLEEAMQPDAPIIHEQFNTYEGVTATPGPGPFGGLLPLQTPSNIYTSRSSDRGDLEKGFAEADLIVENKYYTQRQHQGYLEPQNCAVAIEDDGRIHVWAGSKMPHVTKMGLAGVIDVDANKIVVHHTYIGGDFGAKATPVLLPICYFLAKVSGRPVRIVNDYLEELLSGNPRHATMIKYRTGVKRDGTITALHVGFYVNGGAYGAFKPGGIIFGPEQAAGPYKIANTRIEAAHVYSNTIPGGYMRGPGESQAVFAIESHIDELAHAIGMDPVEFRMKNLVGEGDEAAFGVTFEHVRARETLQAAVEAADYYSPKPPNVGRGVAIGERPPGGGIGNASITFNPDGSVSLGTPIFDQGSGTYTIMIQMAAEELGLPLDRIKLDIWNTDAVPFDSGVAGSWAARVNSGVVHEAITEARKELLAFAARRLEWPAESLQLEGDTIRSTTLNESVRWADLLSETGESVTSGRRTRMEGLGELAHITGFNCQVAEVEVDPETGEVKLRNFISAHDVGRVLNPLGHQGQINGSIVAGIGYALMEEMRVEDGRVTNLSLGDYKLPTSRDLPPLTTVLVETEHGIGPYNIKAIGEGPTTPVAPAIANAVFDACGVRLRELPITAEKVYRALRDKQ